MKNLLIRTAIAATAALVIIFTLGVAWGVIFGMLLLLAEAT